MLQTCFGALLFWVTIQLPHSRMWQTIVTLVDIIQITVGHICVDYIFDVTTDYRQTQWRRSVASKMSSFRKEMTLIFFVKFQHSVTSVAFPRPLWQWPRAKVTLLAFFPPLPQATLLDLWLVSPSLTGVQERAAAMTTHHVQSAITDNIHHGYDPARVSLPWLQTTIRMLGMSRHMNNYFSRNILLKDL